MSAPPKGPYTLVTVNNAPERAQRLVGRVVEIVKDRYVIKHVANAESMFCPLLYSYPPADTGLDWKTKGHESLLPRCSNVRAETIDLD